MIDLKAVEEAVAVAATGAMTRGAERLRDLAREKAPYSVGERVEPEGHLRDRIYSVEARLEGRMIRARVVSPARYSKFQEYPTRHNVAHPFMRPAAAEGRGEIRADVARSAAKAIRLTFRGRIEATAKMKLVR